MWIERTTGVALLAFVTVTAAAEAAPPVDCSDRMDEIAQIVGVEGSAQLRAQWAKHRHFVLHDKPGGSYYAPQPYPKAEDAVLENFRYAYFQKLFDQGPDRLEEPERSIYVGLEEGTIIGVVSKVENWSLSRCSPSRPVPFYHLVRLFSSGGKELARATVMPSGLLGEYAQVTDVASRAWTSFESIEGRVEKMLGRPLRVRRARNVAIDGLPLHCGPLTPCAVFEAEGSTWILDRGALLFEVGPDARRESVLDHRERVRREGAAAQAASWSTPLVTLGFQWVEVALIAEDAELAKLQGLSEGR